MKTRATVIIPTFGNAKFARWAIKSVQNQTVKDIEICIICDGSPDNRVSFFRNMEQEDHRIKVFAYPKSPRTGEPYRDIVIKQATGQIICYCSHDDLWLPNHVQVMEEALRKCCFTHSLHAFVNLPEAIKDENTLLGGIHWINLDRNIMKRMLGGENFFGLTYGAHTRKSYNELQEGWVTTPLKDIPSDLYMWCKFLGAFGELCKTTMKVTALNFPQIRRKDWSERQRDEELRLYFERIHDPVFLRQIYKLSLRFCPSIYQILPNKQINELRNELQDRDSQFKALEPQMQQIQHSIVMQILSKYQRVIKELLPPSTRRGYYYELGLTGIMVILNEGWRSFFRKLKARFWLRRALARAHNREKRLRS